MLNIPLRHYFQHTIIWLVAISVLNCSIGIPNISESDFSLNEKATVADWNEFESIYEWVAEEALDIENAVPEQQNKSGNEHTILKKQAPYFLYQVVEKEKLVKPHSIAALNKTHIFSFMAEKPLSGYITLFSPPPDAA